MMDFAAFVPPEARFAIVNGTPSPLPRDQFRVMPMQDQFDALFRIRKLIELVEGTEPEERKPSSVGSGRVKTCTVQHERVTHQARRLNCRSHVVREAIDLVVADGVEILRGGGARQKENGRSGRQQGLTHWK
jgi:hypothetical protein